MVPKKSASNKRKHGIDFEGAQELWSDPKALFVSAKNVSEERFAIIAELNSQIWFCVYTVYG
jgi:uncharacterized DUF497 family protein